MRWVSLGEYLEFRLFGDAAVSYSVASWTGLLDRHRLTWDEALIAGLSLRREQLSPLTDVDAPRQGLRPPFSERWPALSEVAWFPAVGDGAAANIASGCTSPSRAALSMGTSSAVRFVTETGPQRMPLGLWCYRVDGLRSLPGGALSQGGNVLAWLEMILDLPSGATVASLLADAEPDGHGLTVLPLSAGERSLGWAGDAWGTLHGFSQATTAIDMLRAGMEAVAYGIASVLERLETLLPTDYQLVGSGAVLLNSRVWLQIVADVLGRPVAVSEVAEPSARGAVLLALEALGVVKDVDEAPRFAGDPVPPVAESYNRYRSARARQQALYQELVGGSGVVLG